MLNRFRLGVMDRLNGLLSIGSELHTNRLVWLLNWLVLLNRFVGSVLNTNRLVLLNMLVGSEFRLRRLNYFSSSIVALLLALVETGILPECR